MILVFTFFGGHDEPFRKSLGKTQKMCYNMALYMYSVVIIKLISIIVSHSRKDSVFLTLVQRLGVLKLQQELISSVWYPLARVMSRILNKAVLLEKLNLQEYTESRG